MHMLLLGGIALGCTGVSFLAFGFVFRTQLAEFTAVAYEIEDVHHLRNRDLERDFWKEPKKYRHPVMLLGVLLGLLAPAAAWFLGGVVPVPFMGPILAGAVAGATLRLLQILAMILAPES